MSLVFDIQRFSLDDGPGIRTTVFFKGCPMNCEWCHNPESTSKHLEIAFYSKQCINCKTCQKVCKNNAHVFKNDKHIFDRSNCRLCLSCVEECPNNALVSIGIKMSVDKILEEIMKDKVYYDFSGGGVTFSGGEPTLHKELLEKLINKCRYNDINTAIETCGFFKFDELTNILKNIDLIIYDIKFIDSAKHFKYTGVDNKKILENIIKINKNHKNIWIRVPIILNINTDVQEIKNICGFINNLDNLKRVELLSYHNLGVSKYEALGNKKPPVNFDIMDTEEKQELLKLYENYINKRIDLIIN